MKKILLLALFSTSAFAGDKHLSVLAGPEAYHSTIARDTGWTARPSGEVAFSFNQRLSVLLALGYSEFTYVSDKFSHWNFGPGVAYDLVPERVRLEARLFFAQVSYRNYDTQTVFGGGLRLQYFVPIDTGWKLFVGVGWDLIQRAALRHDTTPGGDNTSCVFVCSDEKAGHVYDHLTVPGSRETSAQVGVSYSFF